MIGMNRGGRQRLKHYIIVKYNAGVCDRQQLECKIAELFEQAKQIDGIAEVSLFPAILHSEKRYDLMICLDMRPDTLDAFDHSNVHRLWKDKFSKYFSHKVIFDCK